MTPERLPSEATAVAGPCVLLVGQSGPLAVAGRALKKAGYTLRVERDSGAALASLDEIPFDLVLVDWPRPGGTRQAMLPAAGIRARRADLYIIALIPADGPAPEQALLAGADDYLTTRFTAAELLARARSGVRSTRLHSTEDRLQALISNVPGAIYRCANDRDWTMELISDEIERISGYPASDFIRSKVRSFASIIHPDDRAQVERDVERGTRQGRIFALEYRIVRADDSLAWVLERGQQVDDRGSHRWLDGVIFDITERKQAEDDLKDSLLRLAVGEDRERIARELHDGVIQSLFGVGVTLQALQGSAGCPQDVSATLAASV
jgi:PAS domain S-box-containing protein